MTEKESVKSTVEAVAGVLKEVPIYQDVVQPAAKEVGKGLQTVAKTIHIALAPISALIWGYERIEQFLTEKLSVTLKDVPPEEIITPAANVAGPAIESLRFTGHEEELRNLYANLLAASMKRGTSTNAHPGFVEIIKQLTPDEAKLLRLLAKPIPLPLLNVRAEYKVETEIERGGNDVLIHFSVLGEMAGCTNSEQCPAYLDNLSRLGLIEIPQFMQYTAPGAYDQLENHPRIIDVKREIEKDPKKHISIERKGVKMTQLGRQFCSICFD